MSNGTDKLINKIINKFDLVNAIYIIQAFLKVFNWNIENIMGEMPKLDGLLNWTARFLCI